MVKWLKIFPFLVPFILASCNAEQQRVIEMKTEVVDGLQFGVPEGRKVETSADHILLLPEQALREVDEIAIWTTAPQPVAGGVDTEGTDPAPHTLTTVEGGMGGPEYTLTIPKQIADRQAYVRAYIQSEGGTPAFDEAWQVWESLAAEK